MFIHLSDWSLFLNELDRKGVPHGGRIIKAFAIEENPALKLGRPSIFTVCSKSSPFLEDEFFSYAGRETYSGPKLEKDLRDIGLDEISNRHVRALFRFGNSPEIQSCQTMMAQRSSNGEWIFKHPFNDIDGIEAAIRNPRRALSIHLDMFCPETLTRLRKVFDIDNKELLVLYGKEILSLISPEKRG